MVMIVFFFFVKQKTAYEIRISDWSSDLCSSDLECLHCLLYDTGTGRLRTKVGHSRDAAGSAILADQPGISPQDRRHRDRPGTSLRLPEQNRCRPPSPDRMRRLL